MAKTLILLAALLCNITAYGQGTVQFSMVPYVATVVTALDPDNIEYGPTAQLPIPVGDRYQAALYYAPGIVTDEGAFTQAGPSVGIGPLPGWINSGQRELPGVFPGGTATVQVRVWDTQDPDCNGFSPLGVVVTGGSGIPPSLPASITAAGVNELAIIVLGKNACAVVPEPSSLALASTLSLVVFYLRKKSNQTEQR